MFIRNAVHASKQASDGTWAAQRTSEKLFSEKTSRTQFFRLLQQQEIFLNPVNLVHSLSPEKQFLWWDVAISRQLTSARKVMTERFSTERAIMKPQNYVILNPSWLCAFWTLAGLAHKQWEESKMSTLWSSQNRHRNISAWSIGDICSYKFRLMNLDEIHQTTLPGLGSSGEYSTLPMDCIQSSRKYVQISGQCKEHIHGKSPLKDLLTNPKCTF